MIPFNKKIAVLHPYLDKKGGASNMMIYLSSILSEKNKVILYSFSRKNSKFINFIKLIYSIRNNDYIIVGNSPMHFIGVISKILFRNNIKIIWWHHHYPWYYNKNANLYIKLKKFLEKIVIKKIDSVIVNSKYLQVSIKNIYGVDSKILYPVLDKKFLDYNKGTKLISNTQKIIFTYGRWVKGKNLEQVFNTYEKLKNKFPKLILKIGGVGDELLEYKNKYNRYEDIVFLGQINITQIINNLEQANLFLFTSKIDSFGLVIIESMSIGVPVVSYNFSGAKEIIINNINGYLVNTDSEFIKRSYDILSNSSLEKTLSIGAINTSMNFTNDLFKKQLSEIF